MNTKIEISKLECRQLPLKDLPHCRKVRIWEDEGGLMMNVTPRF